MVLDAVRNMTDTLKKYVINVHSAIQNSTLAKAQKDRYHLEWVNATLTSVVNSDASLSILQHLKDSYTISLNVIKNFNYNGKIC